MAVSGVGKSMWQFENVFELKKNAAAKQTELSDTQSSEKSESVQKNAEERIKPLNQYLSELGSKYGVNISTYSGSDKSFMSTIMGSGGTSNLVISRNIAEQMRKDPELASVIEERIAKLPEEGKQIERDINAMGHEVLACGMQIEKDGRISYWSIGYDPQASEKQAQCAKEKAEELKERQDKLMEKGAERKKKAKELEEKREARREENAEKMEKLLSRGESPEELIEKLRNNEQKVIKNDMIDTRRGLTIDVSV